MGLFDALSDEKKKKKKSDAVHRLTDMIVTDVDIVDRPANGRRFLLFKRGCGMADESSVEITESEGEVIAVQVSEPDVESGTAPETSEPEQDSQENAQAESVKEKNKEKEEVTEESEEVSKQEPQEEGEETPEKEKEEEAEEEVEEEEKAEEGDMTLPGPVKTAVLGSLREATERLMSVQTVLRSANTTSDKVSAPLPNKIHGELKAIGTLLSTVTERYPSPKTEKAESGASESVRDILKQAGVVMHGEVRDAIMDMVGSNVEKLLSTMNKVKEIKEVEEKSEGELPKFITEAAKAVSDSLTELLNKFPSPAAKSDEVLAKLQEHFDGIVGIVSDVLSSANIIPEGKACTPEHMEDEEDKKKGEDEVSKSEDGDDILTHVKKSLDLLLARMTGGETEDGESKPDTNELPSSNAADADATEEVEKKSDKISWPEDLANSVNEGE